MKEDKYDIGQTDLTLALRNQYDPPAKTLIEVGALVKSTFTASIIDPIPIGRTSVPIKITTETPPHTNITISISLPNPSLSKFEIHPNKLTFTYDVSSRYFTIKVPEDFVLDA